MKVFVKKAGGFLTEAGVAHINFVADPVIVTDEGVNWGDVNSSIRAAVLKKLSDFAETGVSWFTDSDTVEVYVDCTPPAMARHETIAFSDQPVENAGAKVWLRIVDSESLEAARNPQPEAAGA